ncbi:MAG: hypothetical protein ABFD16_22295 [Thermoguttaceae bacterium]
MMLRLAILSVTASWVFLLASGGCAKSPTRVQPPIIDASAAGQKAIATYDVNKDGVLSGPELDKAPALNAAMAKIDADNDGKLTAHEVANRIKQWQASKLGLMPVSCTVRLDGKPLADATVTLVPDACLGPNVQKATGKTDANGQAALSVANPPEPSLRGVAPGFYRVEISNASGGTETIPAEYNQQTTFGLEVAADSNIPDNGITYDLKSK